MVAFEGGGEAELGRVAERRRDRGDLVPGVAQLLTGQRHPQTSVVYEYPSATGDPYYPIPTRENAEQYRAYAALADATPDVHFAGRLATYQYYNMDQVVGQALALWKRMTASRTLSVA